MEKKLYDFRDDDDKCFIKLADSFFYFTFGSILLFKIGQSLSRGLCGP